MAPATLFLAAVVIGATSPTPAGLVAAALVAAVGIACAVALLSPPGRRGKRSATKRRRLRRATTLRVGDYVTFEGALYRVEHVLGDRVLIEDCRSGELFDSAAADVERARKVRRSTQPLSAQGGG